MSDKESKAAATFNEEMNRTHKLIEAVMRDIVDLKAQRGQDQTKATSQADIMAAARPDIRIPTVEQLMHAIMGGDPDAPPCCGHCQNSDKDFTAMELIDRITEFGQTAAELCDDLHASEHADTAHIIAGNDLVQFALTKLIHSITRNRN